MLRNPAYAGVYAYGRSRLDPRRRQPGRPCTGRVRQRREDWLVYLPGRLPAYISIQQYERNLERMDANRTRAQSMGAVRDGPALLTGLVFCGRCGKRMTVRYQRGHGGRLHPSYVCSRDKTVYGGAECQQLAGGCVDSYVSDLLLTAMAPAALEVSIAAAGRMQGQRDETDRIWRQRLERADYAVDRARRQYQLAEPENRLVVRQLERDWEAALAARQQLGEDYDRFTATRPRTLTPAEREQIRALAHDIPAIWNAPSTTDAERKQLIRYLVEQVRLEVLGNSERVHVQITWTGGYRTDGELVRPVATLQQLSYYPRLTSRVRELATRGLTARQIARRLNDEGFRPPKRRERFGEQGVRVIMQQLGCASPAQHAVRRAAPQLGEHEWWLTDLARAIGMPRVTLFSWLQRGWLTARQQPDPPRLWIVRADPHELHRLRQLHQLSRGQHARRPWLDSQDTTTRHHPEGAPDDVDPPQL
jgi:hypothetical protein